MTNTVLTYKGRPIIDLTKNELVDAMTWAFQEIEYQRERADRFLNAATLAEPEPESPTDAELLCIAAKVIGGYGTDGIKPGEYEPDTGCAVESYGSELCDFARAVLARWGRPEPIPVTERLPLPEEVV